MTSFRKAREMLIVAYTDNLISDEELLLLYDFNKSKNLELPYDEHDKFDLGDLWEDEFRFEKKDITHLAEVLQLPPVFKCPQGSVSDDIEGLCMLLHRLAYPVRYSDMVNRFPRPVPVISNIANRDLDYIYETHHHRITSWNNSILYPAALQQYTDAIFDQGAALSNCFVFVNGTVCPHRQKSRTFCSRIHWSAEYVILQWDKNKMAARTSKTDQGRDKFHTKY